MNIMGLLLTLVYYIGISALFFFILYKIVKSAVKKGIIEAHKELEKSE